jgi:hypothetical protein
MLQLLITFDGAMTRGCLVRQWDDGTALLAFEGMLGPYRNFMPMYWYDGAYRDLIRSISVGIFDLTHLPPHRLPHRLNGIRVSIHRQLSPARALFRNEEERIP